MKKLIDGLQNHGYGVLPEIQLSALNVIEKEAWNVLIDQAKGLDKTHPQMDGNIQANAVAVLLLINYARDSLEKNNITEATKYIKYASNIYHEVEAEAKSDV